MAFADEAGGGPGGVSEQLAQLLDRDALEASTGPRGRLAITVPAAWLGDACVLDLTAPARLTCARCDGGGCDGCGKSGVVRAPVEVEARELHATLPGGTAGGVAMRLAQPFGAGCAIEQLILEVRAGDAPTAGVTRRSPPAPVAEPAAPTLLPVVVGILVAVAAVVAALIAR